MLVSGFLSSVMRFLPALGLLASLATAARADDASLTTGSVTKLPIPRFVSLKPSDTPMREGPSKDHRIKWVFKREGLPVEVIGEHEQWRRIRDSESTEGWVYFGRLSNRRTLIIREAKGKTPLAMLKEAQDGAPVVAKLEPGVVAHIDSCSGGWCKVSVEGYSGYVAKAITWGVYPDEQLK